ncbi:MAG TPA: trehalase family glycosidase [Ignavibacteriaceae bacterium]|nr:trehalase family glycosidase [Ignavibacteriaceae bacterium]
MHKLFHNALLLFIFSSFLLQLIPQELKKENSITVNIKQTLSALEEDEDTDKDKRITIEDPHINGTERGDKKFWVKGIDNKLYEISGTYFLSNLLQELKLAEETGKDTAELEGKKIFEPPADRISRMIREYYWDGLTRRIDEQGLAEILQDEKTQTVDGNKYIYVPASDNLAYNFYSGIAKKFSNVKVEEIPENITGDYVRKLNGYHGLLTLGLRKDADGKLSAIPFVVPGGRFNEMYGWDSYFITVGLLQDNRIELAKDMVDNFVYEINNYGKILNANRTYYLTRSQPPFLTSMIRAVLEHLPKNRETKEWLKQSLEAAIKEYSEVWMGKDHLTSTGLSRYFDIGSGISPEVEPGHFDEVFAPYVEKHNMSVHDFEEAYKSGKIKEPELDKFFVHDRAMRESGHDTSYRLIDQCANLLTVDLNSLLYKYETDIAELIRDEFGGSFRINSKDEKDSEWLKHAEKRKELIIKYLWNPGKGMFFDYNFIEKKQTGFVSATTFYPLWAGLANKEQAESLVRNALPLLEFTGGIGGSTEESRGPVSEERPLRQWDYPFGWAPHQVIIWKGLSNYNFNKDVQRLIYKWLYTISSNAAKYNGTIPEKFDVVKRSHDVFAEYGNVGTKFAYITREGFGWTNASFQLGINLLSEKAREQLNKLIPPEWIF